MKTKYLLSLLTGIFLALSWQSYAADCDGVAEWDSSTAYATKGTMVVYNGVLYENKWWTQNENPETNSEDWDVWTNLGTCDGDNDDDTDTNQAPEAVANGPYSALVDASISFSSDGSTDSDGTIASYLWNFGDDSTSTEASPSYAYTTAGTYTVTLTVTDDDGATATASTSAVISTDDDDDDSSDTDCDAPTYEEDGGYSAGSQVSYNGGIYECRPDPYSGWCNGAAWAYAPGSGTYWEDAWIYLGTCDGDDDNDSSAPTVSISSPSTGTTYAAGDAITIEASASDDSTITSVEFYAGSTLLGEATSSPYSIVWSDASTGYYSLTAVATDNEGNTTTSSAVSISVTTDGEDNSDLPKRILVGYLHNFDNGSGIIRLNAVPDEYDVINIAFAEPVTSGSCEMQFTPELSTAAELKADVVEVHNNGKKVLISIGGANAHLSIDTEADQEDFTNSMIDIIETYGFDGMDIDLEGSSLTLESGDTDLNNPTTPMVVNLIEATQDIASHFGSDFILSMAPETAYVQGGISNYAGIFGAYLPVIHNLRDILTYIHVQHYNSGTMTGLDGGIYSQSTADFHVAMAEMLMYGFDVAGDASNHFTALREDQVAIGLPSSSSAAGGGYTSPSVVQNAMDYLINGTSFGGSYTLQNASGYPDMRGLMTWSINWDVVNNLEFASNHRAYLDALDASSAVATSLAVSTESVDVMTLLEESVQITIDEDQYVELKVYDQQGNLISTLVESSLAAGSYSYSIANIKNVSGLVIYKLVTSSTAETIKIMQ